MSDQRPSESLPSSDLCFDIFPGCLKHAPFAYFCIEGLNVVEFRREVNFNFDQVLFVVLYPFVDDFDVIAMLWNACTIVSRKDSRFYLLLSQF